MNIVKQIILDDSLECLEELTSIVGSSMQENHLYEGNVSYKKIDDDFYYVFYDDESTKVKVSDIVSLYEDGTVLLSRLWKSENSSIKLPITEYTKQMAENLKRGKQK